MKSIMEEASSITKAVENAWNRAGQPQEFSVKILEHPKTSFFGLKTSKSAKIALFFNELTVKPKEQPQKPARPVTPRAPQQPRSGGPADQGESRTPYQQPRRPQQSQPRTERSQEDRQTTERQSPSQNQRRPQAPRQERTQDTRQPQSNNFTPRPERPPIRPIQDEPRTDSNFPKTINVRTIGQDNNARSENRPATPRPSYNPESNRAFQDENRETWAPEMIDSAVDWVKETLVMMGKPDITITPYVSHNYLKLTLSQPVLDDARQEETQLKSWGSLAMEAVREKANKPLRGLRIMLESKK